MDEQKYNLAVWCKVEYDEESKMFIHGERMVLEDGARYDIAVMSGNYWVGKFPEDIVMLVEV